MHNHKHRTDSQHKMVEAESSPAEYLKFGLVIIGITAAASFLAGAMGQVSIVAWSRWFMGVFFLTFATFKFIGYQMFTIMFAGYDIIAKRIKLYAYAYPVIELFLAILYLGNLLPSSREYLTVIVMGVGTIGVWQEVKKRSGIHCACLGNVIKLPLSTVSLVEDVAMGLMAFFVVLLS